MDERRHPLLAVGLTLLMCAMFAALDTLVRQIGAAVSMLTVLVWRYGLQTLMMAGWLARGGSRRFVSARPGLQVVRGVLLLSSSALAFISLQHMPVAEFTAVVMLGPAFATLLAATVLHEPVSRARWTLVGVSLAGALIVIRPGSGLFGWVTLLPLSSAIVYAVFQVLTRKYALVEDPYTTHFWSAIVGLAVTVPLLLLSTPSLGATLNALTPWQWATMTAIGLLGSTGHLLLVLAARLAPASALMPFIYAQLGFATLLGWLAFGGLPDFWGWIGIAIIAFSGAANAWLNMRRRH